jgi:SAM-dependent methyltransferase
LIISHLKAGISVGDDFFDAMYAPPMRAVSEFHFTPVEVAKFAAQALVGYPGAKVLDIGSGAGKFCMVGAACTSGYFTGVEQRESLCLLSRQLAKRYELPNVAFIHANITTIEFAAFDAFYLFNPFYEHIYPAGQIDTSVSLERHLYDEYSQVVSGKLARLPKGTRLATYFSYGDEIPDSYQVESAHFTGYLKIWKKIR